MPSKRVKPQVSRIRLLEDARDRLAAEVAECGSRELPSIVRELRLVTAELAALTGEDDQKGSGTVDDLAARRRTRRTAEA